MRVAAHAMLLCVARSFRAPLRASPLRRSLARSAAPRRIDSTKNDFVKLCKTLHRRRGREQTNLVFLEGQRLVGDALCASDRRSGGRSGARKAPREASDAAGAPSPPPSSRSKTG